MASLIYATTTTGSKFFLQTRVHLEFRRDLISLWSYLPLFVLLILYTIELLQHIEQAIYALFLFDALYIITIGQFLQNTQCDMGVAHVT